MLIRGPMNPLIIKVIYIVLCTVLLYYMLKTIMNVIAGQCKSYIEGFDDDEAKEEGMTQAYYTSLHSRAKAVTKRVDTATKKAEAIQDMFSDLHGTICDVTNQIDDGISQNYSSNVSEDEYSLPADVQKKRAEARKKKGLVYMNSLRTKFSAEHDNTPLIECFEDAVRDSIVEEVNEVDSAVATLDATMKQLQNEISDKQIAIYYTTLAYNDKYLKNMVKEMQKNIEGYEDVLKFKTPAQPPTGNPSDEPGERLSKLETRIAEIEIQLTTIEKAVTSFVNTAKVQKEQIKKTKAISQTKV